MYVKYVAIFIINDMDTDYDVDILTWQSTVCNVMSMITWILYMALSNK